MINVLYISHYPDLKMGGQQSMLALIKNLDRTQVNPYAIVPASGELYDRLSEIGCKVFVVPLTALKPKHLFKQILNVIAIRRIIKQNSIDIIHPDHERDSIIGGVAKLRAKAKMVWHVRLTRKVSTDKISVKLSDGIIGISKDVRLRFPSQELIEYKYRTIYNGVDCDVFIPIESKFQLKNELNLDENLFLILFVGQFKIGKGVLDLINSAVFIKNDMSNFRIILIGTPESTEFSQNMQNLINENDLDNYVKIIPQQNNIHRYMQASDILILPSHEGAEGMGRVLFESMACGTPVIGTDVMGVREAITPDTGILVEEKNPKAIYEAINKFIYDQNFKKDAEIASRNRALEVFDIKIHSQNVQKFYRDILKLKS